MSAIDDMADRLEKTLELHRKLGTEVKITMTADAATAFVEQLRFTSKSVDEVDSLMIKLKAAGKCGTCGTPLGGDCPNCQRLWES